MKVINESEKEEKIAKKCYCNFFLIILIHRNKGIRVKLNILPISMQHNEFITLASQWHLLVYHYNLNNAFFLYSYKKAYKM